MKTLVSKNGIINGIFLIKNQTILALRLVSVTNNIFYKPLISISPFIIGGKKY